MRCSAALGELIEELHAPMLVHETVRLRLIRDKSMLMRRIR